MLLSDVPRPFEGSTAMVNVFTVYPDEVTKDVGRAGKEREEVTRGRTDEEKGRENET